MYTALLILVNFITIFGLINLTINKLYKLITSKPIVNKETINYLKKMQLKSNNILIFINLFMLFLNTYINSILLVGTIFIIDIIVIISLGVFTNLQGSIRK